MAREFEIRQAAELDATPEQVWDAIATGPGIDSWYIGRNEVTPGEGGTVRTIFGEYAPESRVTAWEPQRRFAYHSGEAPDGRFIAYEFLIEGRSGASTVLRTVTSGVLPGDDWQDEFEAMTNGLELFFATLVEHLTHFPGRTATSITAFGPPVTDWENCWAVLHGSLGLTGPPTEGDRIRSTLDGLAPVDGVVYFSNPNNLGLRTGEGLYRFMRGLGGGMVVGHHIFVDLPAGVDQDQADRDWESWLTRLFA